MKVAYILYQDASDRIRPASAIRHGVPDKTDASTLRLVLRVQLGDRPLQMATLMNRQAVAARLVRTRRALSERRASVQSRRIRALLPSRFMGQTTRGVRQLRETTRT
jgi:hypothetical protein